MNRDPLVHFLYLLMRDHLPTGKVEEIMQHLRKAAGRDCIYSAPDLQRYAEAIAGEMEDLGRVTLAPDDTGAVRFSATNPQSDKP